MTRTSDGDDATLFLGDCLDVMRSLPDASVDAVLTDPPYGVAYRGKNRRYGVISGDREISWLPGWTAELARVCKPDVFAVCFYGWPEAGAFLDAFRAARWRPTSHLVFVKNQIGLGYHTRGKHEQAYLFARGKAKPNQVGTDVFPWTRVHKAVHPNQKPLDALIPLVERFTRPGDVVLDPYMGSGSTGVACLAAGRKFLGIELDPAYHAVAARRISDARAARTPAACA